MKRYFLTALLALTVATCNGQRVTYFIANSGDTSLFDEIICKMEDNIATNYYSGFDETLDLPMQYYAYTYDSAKTLLFAKYMEVQRAALWLRDEAATDSYLKKLGVPPDNTEWRYYWRSILHLSGYRWNSFVYLNEPFAKKDLNSIMNKIVLGLNLSPALSQHIDALDERRKGAGMNAFRKYHSLRYRHQGDSTYLKSLETKRLLFMVDDTIYEGLPCYLLKRETTGSRRTEENEVHIINKNDYALLHYSRTSYSPKSGGGEDALLNEATYAKVGNIYRNIQYTRNYLEYDSTFDEHKQVYFHVKGRLWRDAPPVDSAAYLLYDHSVEVVKEPNALMLEEWNKFMGGKAE